VQHYLTGSCVLCSITNFNWADLFGAGIMITINGNWIRCLALAVALGVAGASILDPLAIAQQAKADSHDDDEEDKKEKAAAKKKNGKKDGKNDGKKEEEDGEEKEDELGWTFKAKLNRAITLWDDSRGVGFLDQPGLGFGNTRTRGARFVDNSQDNSGAEAEYKFNIANGWTGTIKFGLDAMYARSDFVSQFDRDGDGTVVELKDALFELGHDKFGKIIVGLQDSASDGTSDLNLAYSNYVADAEVNNWNDSFFLRTAGIGLTGLRWGDFFAGPDVGDSGKFVKYVTPKFMGFEAAVAVGQPMSVFLFTKSPLLVEEQVNGLLTDFGVKYFRRWGDFLVRAGFGVFRNTAEEHDAEEPTEDTGWGGSFALMHIPTGLNIAINHGEIKHTDKCIEPGVVTGKCRGQDKFTYVKGGVVKNVFGWGASSLYGEYYKGWLNQNLSDDEQLRVLEVNPDQALELESSVMKVWGVGVTQTIDRDPSRHRFHTTDFYLGYRNYSLDVNLLGATGAVAPARRISDWSAIMAGVRLSWGKPGGKIGVADDDD
jgi:hypothetical protein